MPETKGPYCARANDGMRIWEAETLWRHAESLPLKRIPLSSLPALEEVRWFNRQGGDPKPTCKAVAAHARLIYEADLTYPIILSSSGDVMDGMHRIAKAWLLGQADISAVQFETDPEPDQFVPDEPSPRTPLLRRLLSRHK